MNGTQSTGPSGRDDRGTCPIIRRHLSGVLIALTALSAPVRAQTGPANDPMNQPGQTNVPTNRPGQANAPPNQPGAARVPPSQTNQPPEAVGAPAETIPEYALPRAEQRNQPGGPVASERPTPVGAAPLPLPGPPVPLPPNASPPAAPTTFTIHLGPRHACVQPRTEKLGGAQGGTILVESPQPDTMTALLSGAAAASAYLGCHSSAAMSFEFAQEFEVRASDPSAGFCVLTIDSTLVGYLRARHRAGARVTVATASVAPLNDCVPPLVLTHPPQILERTGGQLCNLRLDPLVSPPIPVGRYRLAARLIIEADAAGLLDGHSAADFSPDAVLAGPFVRPRDPFQGVSKTGFGFTIVLKASAPTPLLARTSDIPTPATPRIAQRP